MYNIFNILAAILARYTVFMYTLSVCACVRACLCVHACMFMCIHAYLCVYVCVSMRAFVHSCVCGHCGAIFNTIIQKLLKISVKFE